MRDDYSLMRRKSNYTLEIRRNKMLGFFFIATTWRLSLTTRRKLLIPLLFSSLITCLLVASRNNVLFLYSVCPWARFVENNYRIFCDMGDFFRKMIVKFYLFDRPRYFIQFRWNLMRYKIGIGVLISFSLVEIVVRIFCEIFNIFPCSRIFEKN